MEASPPSQPSAENWAEQFDQSLNLQRDRVREFLDAQQERFQRVETELDRQLEQFADELAQDRNEFSQTREELRQRSEQLTRETQSLKGLKEELGARQAEWEQLQERATRQQEALVEQIRQQQDQLDHHREELAKRQSEIDAAEAKLHHDQQKANLARQEHEAELEQLTALREQLDAGRAELDAREEQLADRQADTESRRRRIAREFKAQHAAQLKEIERRRAEIQQRDTSQQAELQQQLDTVRGQQEESAAEAKASQQQIKELEAELQSLHRKYERLEKKQSGDDGADGKALKSAEAELAKLRAELGEIGGRLKETQQELAEAREAGAKGQPTDEDSRRRYEMMLEDLREIKARNAQLEEQLVEARSAQLAAPALGGVLDWEAEKQRILASLESDFGEDNEEAKAKRLAIEDVIKETDKVLARRDGECTELRQLLEDQSASLGSMAVGAAALGEALDSDTIIQEEREKLKELQQQWSEKLRQAEVDISIERATLAREKAEIEETLHTIRKQGNQAEGETSDGDSTGQPVRGRWLKRLGLKDTEEKSQ